MMPIRPENRARYPPNWKELRAAVLERARNRCEGSPLYPECRAENGQSHPVTGGRVVLTTAHLEDPIENCDLANLRAWCQRCHLTYDAQRHAQNARRSKYPTEHPELPIEE
jgi:hypothetical protein